MKALVSIDKKEPINLIRHMLLEAKFRRLSLYGPTIQEFIYAVKYSNIAKTFRKPLLNHRIFTKCGK